MAYTEERTQMSLLRRERQLRPDLMLVIPYLLLTALGLVMIYTASAPRLEEAGVSPTRELEQQAAFVLVGFAAFAIVSVINLSVVRPWVPALYLGSVVTLILVLEPARFGGEGRTTVDPARSDPLSAVRDRQAGRDPRPGDAPFGRGATDEVGQGCSSRADRGRARRC